MNKENHAPSFVRTTPEQYLLNTGYKVLVQQGERLQKDRWT